MLHPGTWHPLANGQEALWFLWRLAPESHTYNIVFPARVRGRLDVEVFGRCLDVLASRHPGLRAEFREEEGVLEQRAGARGPSLEVLDASAWDEARINAAIETRARRPFDLEQDARPRVTLLRRAQDEQVLILVMHHILADLWSFIIVMDELRALLAATAAGTPPEAVPLSPVGARYEDHVYAERATRDSPTAAADLSFWQERLAGELPVLDLASDRPRPPLRTFHGGTRVHRVAPDLVRAFKMVVGLRGCTLFMGLLAAYEVLLGRYTGQERLVVGSPVSGRHRPELAGVVGDFVNMVPLRADLSGRPTFEQLLDRTRPELTGALEHQDYPFALLVDRLRLARDPSRSPVFQTTFVLQKFHRFKELARVLLAGDDEAPIPFGPVSLEPIPLTQQDGQYDLNLEMKEDERGGLVGAWKYAADLYDPETIDDLAERFEVLLRAIVADPRQPIDRLALYTAEQRAELLARAVGPTRSLPAESVWDLVEAQVRARPDAIALSNGAETLTYGELGERVRRLAWALVGQGVGRDAIVGVLLPRGFDFVTALLAVSAAGGAFLPMDPRQPAARVGSILQASAAALVLVPPDADASGLPCPAHTIDALTREVRETPLPALRGCDLAYVMYTSGSTGAPKGAMVEHAGMVNHVLAKLSDLGMDHRDTLAQTGPQSFDIIVWQCVAPLVVGGRVAVFPDACAEDPRELLGELVRREVTVLQVVPSMLAAILDEIPEGRPLALPALRWMVPTGEALPTALTRRWQARHPDIPVLNTYGSTECSDDQCHYVVPRLGPDEATAIVSIGTPIPNMASYVLDQHLEPVPPGVVGELYVGGLGVGRGYLGAPQLTEQAFVPDPFSTRPGARLYRTRDRVRQRRDGNLDFLGRVDHMIKLRGFRIEPAEIEAALRRHPGVSGAAVVALRPPAGELQLVAYVVCEGAVPDDVREFLAARLPAYMLPAVYVALATLPLTANGKLDLRALPAPTWGDRPSAEHVRPRTPTELVIARIWSQVLRLEDPSVTDDFFAIGGDSIQSIRVVAACRRAGLRVRPGDVFLNPNIAALALAADAAGAAPPETQVAPAQAPTTRHPATAMQQGMLFHSLSDPSSGVYVQQLACDLHGPLDEGAFRKAWARLAERHEALRTAFEWRGQTAPLQVVRPSVEVPLRVVEGERSEAEIEELRLSEQRRGFQLDEAPLWRVVLARRTGASWQLVWTWHHAILDAWSVPILLRELLILHDAGRAPAGLPAVRPFSDFVRWLDARDRRADEAFWRGRLAGLTASPPLALGSPGAPRSGEGLAHGHPGYGLDFVPLLAEEFAALSAVARRERLTLNTLVQGAWALLLARYTGHEDIVFGTAVAGRPAELDGVEEMVGLFINTLPVRVRVQPDRPVGAWLRELQEAEAAARGHEHVPLADLRAWTGVKGELFDTLLVFENYPVDTAAPGGSRLRIASPRFVERASFPLTVTMALYGEPRLGAGYDLDRFDRAAVLRLLGQLRRALARMAADLAQPLAAVDVLSDEERAGILRWSRGDDPALPAPRPVTEIFADRAGLTPDAPAALFIGEPDEVWTYGELRARAGELARWLHAEGVTRGARVVLYMRPSLARLAATLAVLSVGAAYVPVEVDFPAERVAWTIADSGASHVLVDPDGEVDAPSARVLRATEVTAVGASGDPPGPTLDDLAYVIYTSGSTGRPKGVCVDHRSLHHLVAAQIHHFQLTPESRELQFASSSWDASVSEVFTALCAGASLVLAPRRVLLPSRELLAHLRRLEVTHATFPPSVLAQLPADNLPSLRTLVVAGEVCSAELVARWAPGRRFLNAYGPTEATVCATILEVREPGRPSIGRPIGEARVYLLDGARRMVPPGAPGELHIGGPGVARGYHGRPDLTDAAFVPDPFAGAADARMYRTGDRARLLPSGEFEYLGRVDDQVKLRGFRIEPGEIEAALADDPDLRAAAVGVAGVGDEARLTAWVVHAGAASPRWWPSLAEYLVYDELAYHAMTSDERRNQSYRAAIRGAVEGRVVLEVGAGPEALLARFCVEAGAKHVYSVELLADSHRRSVEAVRARGLEDRITVIHGDATRVDLPEPAEVCVSEIVGALGGCEGAAVIQNGVRRLLRAGATVIPRRSTTLFAPVQLPAGLLDRMGFEDLPARYVQKIFESVGAPFDLRLCAQGLSYADLLAPPAVFEDLDFQSATDPEPSHDAAFTLTRAGRVDGFLAWLTLDTGGGEVLDILAHEHCWLPVFLPAFGEGLAVSAGDRIHARARARLIDGLHPDYLLDGTVDRAGSAPEAFHYRAAHAGGGFRETAFYHRFFADGTIPRTSPAPSASFDPARVRERLRRRLPEHMIPAVIVPLSELPFKPGGKLDRSALPAPRAAVEVDRPPTTDTERAIAALWARVLGVDQVGARSNFFDLGGHSLLLLQVQEGLREGLAVDVPVADLFRYPTVEALAEAIRGTTTAVPSTDELRERGARRQASVASRAAARREAQQRGTRERD